MESNICTNSSFIKTIELTEIHLSNIRCFNWTAESKKKIA